MRLDLNDITVSYGGRRVIDGCSYSFHRAGMYVLTGENGSGKSTLMRVAALLEAPTSGSVEYADGSGSPLEGGIGLRRRITLVLPRAGIFNMSVFDNAAYGLRLRKVPSDEIRHRVDGALQFVGLRERAAQNALTLSSGESQRLALARALVIEPEVVFLDEPTASVDRKNVAIIEEIVASLTTHDRTIIMTTHDEAQAMRLGGVHLGMEDGRLLG